MKIVLETETKGVFEQKQKAEKFQVSRLAGEGLHPRSLAG